MASTVTITRDVALNGVSSLDMALARGMTLEMGTVAFPASMLAAGTAFALKMNRAVGCFISPQDGFVFEYDPVNAKVFAWSQDSNVDGAFTAYSGDLSAYSNVPYFAFGF